MKKEEEEEAPPPPVEVKRELTPELAKISALVTGQPKPKVTTTPPNSNLSKCFEKGILFLFFFFFIYSSLQALFLCKQTFKGTMIKARNN